MSMSPHLFLKLIKVLGLVKDFCPVVISTGKILAFDSPYAHNRHYYAAVRISILRN